MEELLDHRAYRAASIAVFALLLCLPAAGWWVGLGGNTYWIERREPAARPPLPDGLEALASFPKEMEAHLDDSFGFRAQLVTAHSLLHLALGVSGSPRYLLGKDGWLFHRSVDHVLAQSRGVDRFTPSELEDWIRAMEGRQGWLAERGIGFLVMVAPSKHAIYPEYLPEWAAQVGPTRYDQLKERLGRGSTLERLDLHEPLLRAKGAEPLYFRSDGHWNDLGAFVAYRALAGWISSRHPGVRGLARDDFSLAWRSEAVGTIAPGLNLLRYLPEPVPHLELRGPSRVVFEEVRGRGRFGIQRDIITRTGMDEGPAVMLIRDSFATPVARFLRETVPELVLVHHRNGGFPRSSIQEFEPDLVIYELAERGLVWPLR